METLALVWVGGSFSMCSHYLVHSFTFNFELLLTRGIRLFNKNKALRNFFGLKVSLTQCDFCPVL
jgi:hypothetical protein